MKLTKTQIEYALTRLTSKIAEKKEADIKRVNSKLENPEAIFEFLKESKVPTKPKAEFVKIWNDSYYVRHMFKLFNLPSSFDKEYDDYRKAEKAFDAKYDKIKQNIKDRLYLCGDAEEALLLINSI